MFCVPGDEAKQGKVGALLEPSSATAGHSWIPGVGTAGFLGVGTAGFPRWAQLDSRGGHSWIPRVRKGLWRAGEQHSPREDETQEGADEDEHLVKHR